MADKSKSYGDKDIATNLLVTLKHMKAELNTFTQEASNDELFTKSMRFIPVYPLCKEMSSI